MYLPRESTEGAGDPVATFIRDVFTVGVSNGTYPSRALARLLLWDIKLGQQIFDVNWLGGRIEQRRNLGGAGGERRWDRRGPTLFLGGRWHTVVAGMRRCAVSSTHSIDVSVLLNEGRAESIGIEVFILVFGRKRVVLHMASATLPLHDEASEG